jgi:energy-coupling factor transporter ATP-binding protein EcfA2
MRFLTLALEGYGRFRERVAFEFDAGLNCFVGDNESGKSTLLAALMDALYTSPTSTAQSVRERISWGHLHGWTLELVLELRGERVRLRKFHPVDDPRKRGAFTLEYGDETLSGDAARARWEQLWRVPEAVYRATACVAQRALARIEKGDLKSLQQQLRESAVSADLNRIVDALDKERRRLNRAVEDARNRLHTQDQRLHAARQTERQRRELRERLRQIQQETDALRQQLEEDERLLERWRDLQALRTRLEHLRREADTNQRHLDQLEQIERRLQALETELQHDFALWQALPADHKEQIDAAWVRYQDAVRRLSALEREAQAARHARQASTGRRRARAGYAVSGVALCAASVPLWGVAPALGVLALALGLVALAIALLWREHAPKPDALPPALEAARHEAESHWQQLTALLEQAGYAVEMPAINGEPNKHAGGTLLRLQHALQRYSEQWNAFQQRLAEQKRLHHQRDALHQIVPDPKALRERQRELAVQIVGLEEQIRRNPLAHGELPESELLRLDDRVQRERQRLDALQAEQLRCEGALHTLQIGRAARRAGAGTRSHAAAGGATPTPRARDRDRRERCFNEANARYLSDLRPRLKPRIEQHLPVLTLGRYTQAELGEDLSLQVYHPDRGETLPVKEDTPAWSAGVLDQLFFACRLGLADALSNDLRLPLLLDEPFVYSDTARYRAALELLTRVAQQTQVILFTCRPLPEGKWGKVVRL